MSIRIHDVHLSLSNRPVLQGITFEIPAGSPVALVGPNGAGKTTTMRVLATLLRPTSGTVEIAGIDVLARPLEVRRRIGLLPEEPGLFGPLTVLEHLRLVAESHGLRKARLAGAIERVVDLLGLEPWLDHRAAALSKGTRQKTALAMALVHDPPVLLLDEPTANLDVLAQAATERLLTDRVFTAGRTVLVATHSLDLAQRVCRGIVGLYEGRVFLEGSVRELAGDSEGLRGAFFRALASAAARTVA